MTTSRDIGALAPEMQHKAREFVARCAKHGIDAMIYCTFRSPEDQATLYAQGRTERGNIVTWAKPGQSKHNLSIAGNPASLAFDAVPVVAGRAIWEKTGENRKRWLQMGICAKELGLTWGGTWSGTRQDFPHFELKI